MFSKPPLEIACRNRRWHSVSHDRGAFEIQGAAWGTDRDQVMRMAIANRRKQQAQAVWLRRRIEDHLRAGDPLIVLGDLNDGPGLDEYEHLFGRSSVEIMMGEGG